MEAQEVSNVEQHWNPMEFLAHWVRDHLPHSQQTREFHQGCHNPNRTTPNNSSVMKKNKREAEISPHVTLYFDKEKKCTIAVLSRPTEPLSVYFSCRVEQGTADQRSILYYELKGFVRENFTNLRKQQYLRPEALRIAVGSLEASDEVQKLALEEQRRYKAEQREDFTHFEEAMEVVRLHFLNDHLDALSVWMLSQVSRSMRIVAFRIAHHRMQELDVSVCPYVDGATLDGFSNFNRTNNTKLSLYNNVSLVQHMESGRAVEYHQCPEIPMRHQSMGIFIPIAQGSSVGDCDFSWRCEELALGNLHTRWCYNLEYTGQKLIVSCALPPADMVDAAQAATTKLSTARIEANPRPGKRTVSNAQTHVEVNIQQSEMRQLDVVAMLYSGHATVESVKISFLALVRAVARQSLAGVRMKLDAINETRPLLDHERTYLQLVQEAAASL